MNIYSIIQAALIAINSAAKLYMLEKSRAEEETMNYDTAAVVIDTKFTTDTEKSKSLELNSLTKYNIDFITPDEWDNKDYDAANAGSFQLVEDMKVLANSVFWVAANKNYLPLTASLKWSFESLFRVNSNTMSGVRATISIPYKDLINCDYNA